MSVDVSSQLPDFEHLDPILQRFSSSPGELLMVLAIDAGYWSDDNAKVWSDQGIDAYNAIAWLMHGSLSLRKVALAQ